MKNKIIYIVAVVFLFVSCAKQELFVPSELTNNPLITELDNSVNESFLKYNDSLNTVGVSIGILKDGEMHFYGYGETTKGSGKIPNKDTYFEIGSITKTFTAIAIAEMLITNNQIIETPIKSYLPSDLPTLQRNGIELSFKHLLTHSSGLPYIPDNFGRKMYSRKIDEAWAAYDNDKLFSCLLNVKLRFDPFTNWEYSNTAFGVLGVILERNYNKNYGEILKEQIFTPLNLDNTFTDFEETDLANWATGYQSGNEANYWKSLNALDGAGVIKSTAEELLKYAEANLNPPANTLGEAILLTHQITYPQTIASGDFQMNGCLGWFEYSHKEIPGKKFLFHNGGTGGFNTELYISVENQTALVVLFNTDGDNQVRRDFIKELLILISE